LGYHFHFGRIHQEGIARVIPLTTAFVAVGPIGYQPIFTAHGVSQNNLFVFQLSIWEIGDGIPVIGGIVKSFHADGITGLLGINREWRSEANDGN
jgi:hypothetical protein